MTADGKSYRVWMHSKPAMARTYYRGKVDVHGAPSVEAAVEEAIRRAARVHGHRDWIVEWVEFR